MMTPRLRDVKCNISNIIDNGIDLIVSEIESVIEDIDIGLNTVDDLKANQESIKFQLEEIIKEINY